MRASLWIAAGLLVTNIALLKREAPAPQTPPAKPLIVETPPVREPARPSDDTQRVQWFWQATHGGFSPPDCDQHDPVASLDADVDPTPGREHVIGNRQFGVLVYAENGTLLAHMAPVGCVVAKDGDQSLSLSFDRYLLVHTRELEADGEHRTVRIVERRADELKTLLVLDAGGDRADMFREWQVEGRLSFNGDEVLVKYHGRERVPGGAWEEVDDHCTWQLATHSSSCRKRAGARTPEPE
jgi:hypothetical protein